MLRMRIRFWTDARGRQPVMSYLREVQRHGETRIFEMFDHLTALLADHGPALGMPYSRMIDRRHRLYELRAGDHRIAYIAQDDVIVLLHAWRKRSRKLDQREVATALRRLTT